MSRARHSKNNTSEPIELFATADGIRAVDSPVRVKILAMLKGKEMPFDEIVSNAGKAKSTVSVHLNDMIHEGIIGSRLDAHDRRKKIFFIDSSYLGGLAKDRLLEEDVRNVMARGLPNTIELFKLMFRTIRVELYLQGINIDPVLCDAGYKVGTGLYTVIGTPDTDTLLAGLAAFWSEHQLGRLVIASRDPLTLVVYDCFECSDLPLLGRPACAFDLGVLRGVFDAHSGVEQSVKETECYAMGNGRCCFVVAGNGQPAARPAF
jgi:predicted hydrocarbon binding protein